MQPPPQPFLQCLPKLQNRQTSFDVSYLLCVLVIRSICLISEDNKSCLPEASYPTRGRPETYAEGAAWALCNLLGTVVGAQKSLDARQSLPDVIQHRAL
jgi:hypothetical protein